MLEIKPIHTKRLGQHFLHDKYYLKRIINALDIQPQDCFIEIGPGGGALTSYLLPLVYQLIAIEVDPQLCHHLQEKLGHWGDRFRLYQADALKVNSDTLSAWGVRKSRLIGNLPYNIATPLLFHWLFNRTHIDDFHIMLQKEVAHRITASPGDKAYSRLSVMMQYYCEVFPLFEVKPGAFFPPPQVDSAVIRMIPLKKTPFLEKDEKQFAMLVKVAFNQRRKMIKNSLRPLGIHPHMIIQSEVDLDARPQMLSVQDYVRLFHNWTEKN